jgi:hypothetical protein
MLRGDKTRALIQALMFAAYGALIFYYLTVFHLHDPWFMEFLRVYTSTVFIFARRFPRIYDVFLYCRLIFLPGPILGLCAWLIYRRAFHSDPRQKDALRP